MPKKIDPEVRRRELVEALWRVTRRDGWEAVSIRHVAAEAGVSIGMVQHYFTTKDDLLRFAMDMIGQDYGQRVVRRVGELPEPRDPRAIVEIVLDELMPRDGRGRAEVQAAAAFLGRAMLHPEIATSLVADGARLTHALAEQIRRGQPANANPERDAAGLLALADGLIAHLLTGRLTRTTAEAILDAQLDRVFAPHQAFPQTC
jgi:AcrR family transcriptional regulator